MTLSTLDVTALPDSLVFKGVELADLVGDIQPTVELWARLGLVKKVDSLGFAVVVTQESYEANWDDPEHYVSFIGGWGEDKLRYVANAVRKLRPAIREWDDTLTMLDRRPGIFQDAVGPTDEDGSFPWGDFPYGGATHVVFGDEQLIVAVSALTQEQDDLVASFIGKLIGMVSRPA